MYTYHLRWYFTRPIRSTHVDSLMFVYLHKTKVLTQVRIRCVTTIPVVCGIPVVNDQIFVSLWNMTCGLVAMLLSSLCNILVTKSLEMHIPWLRELTWWTRNAGYWDRKNPNKTCFRKCMKNDDNRYESLHFWKSFFFKWTCFMPSEKHPMNY